MSIKFLTSTSVAGAFNDSDDDPGTAGQILTSTGSGTNWVTPSTRDTVYTPRVFNLVDAPSIGTQGFKIASDFSTPEIAGTTIIQQAPSSNTDFLVDEEGVGIYEVSYSVFYNSTSPNREAIGTYMTLGDVPVNGSLMVNYLRANVAGGGNWSSCSNTFFINVTDANFRMALCVRRADVNTPPLGLSMQAPAGMSVKSTVSFRRIS